MQIQNILKSSYWFYQPFIAIGVVRWVWIIGFLVLVLGGLVARMIRIYKLNLEQRTRETLRRSGNMLITMGFLGLLWFFFRQEQVAFLAWRFWLILWLVIFGWWIYRIIFYVVKRSPMIQNEQAKKIEMEKYLPKSKK